MTDFAIASEAKQSIFGARSGIDPKTISFLERLPIRLRHSSLVMRGLDPRNHAD
jgi:hypothetical protein